MDNDRTIYVAGDYIASQKVETQNVYINNDNNIADKIKHSQQQQHEVIDVDYEPLDAICPYIDKQTLTNAGIYSPLEFESMLRNACEQDAPTLANFLKKYQKSGYIDFHGHNKRQIYQNLRAYFSTMRQYSYANFANFY